MKKSSIKVGQKQNTNRESHLKDVDKNDDSMSNILGTYGAQSLMKMPITSDNVLFLQDNIGNQVVSRHIQTKSDNTIQRDPPTIDMPDEQVTIDGGNVITNIPSEDEDINTYIGAIKTHIQALIDRHQTAFGNFARQVQDQDLGSSEAEILGAALKKGIEIGTKKLVDTIGKKLPGVSEAVDIVGAMTSEVDRARDAAREDQMDDFINGIASEVVMRLTNQLTVVQQQNVAIRAEIKRRLASAGASDSNQRIVWLVNNVVQPTQELAQVPSIADIELGMVQEWLNHIRGRDFSWGTWKTKGHLFFYYKVDEEQGTCELEEKALAGGEYANSLLEVLQKDVFKNRVTVSMAELELPSVVRVQSEQNRFKDDTFNLGPGRIDGGDDAWHMFSRIVRKLPEQINIRNLEAKNTVYI